MDKQLLEKIRAEAKTQLDSGKTIPEVGSAMLKAGYKKEEVDEILKPFIKDDGQTYAIFGIIWGVIGMAFSLFPILGPVLGIGGAVFAIKSKNHETGNLWEAGLIISLIAIIAQPLILFGLFRLM